MTIIFWYIPGIFMHLIVLTWHFLEAFPSIIKSKSRSKLYYPPHFQVSFTLTVLYLSTQQGVIRRPCKIPTIHYPMSRHITQFQPHSLPNIHSFPLQCKCLGKYIGTFTGDCCNLGDIAITARCRQIKSADFKQTLRPNTWYSLWNMKFSLFWISLAV